MRNGENRQPVENQEGETSGAAILLARLSETVARHLPGGDAAGHVGAEKVRFHTLNRATGNRVHARYVDAETGKPVDEEDQVKGYERDDGEYIMFEDEELDAVALESTRTIG